MKHTIQKPVPILALLIGLLTAWTVPGYGQQTKVKAVTRVIVVDSKGNTVGTALGGASIFEPINEVRPRVLLDINGRLVPVQLSRNRFYAGVNLLFDSQGCTGNAWYPPDDHRDGPPLIPRAVIGPPGQTLYAEKPEAASQTVTTRSRFINGNQCVNFQFSLQVVPMEPLVDLLTVFTPPFSLKAAP